MHKHLGYRRQATSYLVKIRKTEIRNGIHVYNAGYTGRRDQKRIVLKDTGNKKKHDTEYKKQTVYFIKDTE